MNQPKRVLIMAGGTGGHIFPALAVAEILREKGAQLYWLATMKGMENQLVPATGIPMQQITINGLRGKGVLTLLLAPFRLLRAIIQARAIIKKINPNVILGMGGFASGPGGIAAKMLKIPLVIHEQNAVAGVTNRILARFAVRVMMAFPNSFPKKIPAILVGNPVRKEITTIIEPLQRLRSGERILRLLILGGSQGAKAINECVPQALACLPTSMRVDVWHQAGKTHQATCAVIYEKLFPPAKSGVHVRVDAFITEMDKAYAWADIVICRAGALTVAELAAAGIGSILIPFPHAVDDHQTHNAKFLADNDAAILLPQSELTAQKLANLLIELSDDRSRLLNMAIGARNLNEPKAAELVAMNCLEACRE